MPTRIELAEINGGLAARLFFAEMLFFDNDRRVHKLVLRVLLDSVELVL